MICNRTEKGWEVIYQQAHGLLAAQLLLPWRADERPEAWMELLTATAQHDNGWQEWEPGQHRTALGTPLHFEETPVADLVAQSERAVVRARHQSLRVGLLVSTHVGHLYRQRSERELEAMLAQQRDLRRQWRRALGVRQDEIDRDYEWLRWADTFSLVLAQRKLPFGERRIEIERVGGERYYAWQRADGTVGVSPWPYDAEHVEVGVDAYPLRQLTFTTDAALAEALAASKPQRVVWTIRREA